MSDSSESAGTAEAEKSAPKPPKKASTLPAGELLTPAEHARACGKVKRVKRGVAFKGQRYMRESYDSIHAAAAVLHGWQFHEHHAGEPMRLTREAYEAALKAAANPINVTEDDLKKCRDDSECAELRAKHGHYQPHPAALSPHKPKG